MKSLLVLVSCIAFVSAASNLIDVAQTKNNGSTFVNLLTTANLAASLQNPAQGAPPMTILVPVDSAWAKLPPDVLNNLKSDTSALTTALQYHIIKGDIFEFDLASGLVLKSINGHSVRVYDSRGNVYFNQAKVLGVERLASNGVVYFIDEVLNVPEGTIDDILMNPDYNASMFFDLVDRAHFARLLNRTSGTRYTVFAPSNSAMATLGTDALNKIKSSTHNAQRLVEYHIHHGTLHAKSLHQGRLSTLYPRHYINLSGNFTTNTLKLNNVAELTIEDIEAEGGLVHIISHVLVPSSLASIIG